MGGTFSSKMVNPVVRPEVDYTKIAERWGGLHLGGETSGSLGRKLTSTFDLNWEELGPLGRPEELATTVVSCHKFQVGV